MPAADVAAAIASSLADMARVDERRRAEGLTCRRLGAYRCDAPLETTTRDRIADESSALYNQHACDDQPHAGGRQAEEKKSLQRPRKKGKGPSTKGMNGDPWGLTAA